MNPGQYPHRRLSGSLKPIPALLGAAALLCCAGCRTFTAQPYYERFGVEMDFDTSLRDGDYEQTHERAGVELIIQPFDDVECFADIAGAALNDRDESRLDADGFFLGAGARSTRPVEPGWSFAWNFRTGYHNLDFGSRADQIDPDWEYSGSEVALRVGGMRAFPLGSETLFGLQAGAFVMEMSEHLTRGLTSGIGTFWWLASGGKLDPDGEDPDYEFSSVGAYAGIDIFRPASGSLDFSAGAFLGTSDVVGFRLGLGIRF
jgi:hypothetical protein